MVVEWLKQRMTLTNLILAFSAIQFCWLNWYFYTGLGGPQELVANLMSVALILQILIMYRVRDFYLWLPPLANKIIVIEGSGAWVHGGSYTSFPEARQKRHEFITVEHLLLALLDNPTAAEVLRACGANMDELRRNLTQHVTEQTPRIAADREVDTKLCEKANGRVIQQTQYMVHVWSVPGYEMTEANGGMFGEVNPKLDCADGSYYMLPVGQWHQYPLNVCKANPQ